MEPGPVAGSDQSQKHCIQRSGPGRQIWVSSQDVELGQRGCRHSFGKVSLGVQRVLQPLGSSELTMYWAVPVSPPQSGRFSWNSRACPQPGGPLVASSSSGGPLDVRWPTERHEVAHQGDQGCPSWLRGSSGAHEEGGDDWLRSCVGTG